MTVAVPTLAADARWLACIESLRGQSLRDFEVVVIDNSGARRVSTPHARVIHNSSNRGFGAALNQAWRSSDAPFLAALNDDAEADARWLEEMVNALSADPRCGMAASHVRLPDGALDSSGMLIARDGSSVQRRHGADAEALLPSGSAALYRRELLQETGGFDESFFLYCEDTDLGLRARWLGWTCRYVPQARVTHQYSASAGRASALKAYLVERNRLRMVVKCFPLGWLLAAPFAAAWRYLLHLAALLSGRGKAAEFFQAGQPAWQLAWFVLKAHLSMLAALPRLLAARRAVPRRISASEMASLFHRHLVSLREVASH